MSVIRAGEFVFFECNVAFHLERETPYTAWRSVGVYFTSIKTQSCKYTGGYEEIEDEFFDLLSSVDSETVRSSYEFLDIWRKKHNGALSVITPVIKYHTTYNYAHTDLVNILYRGYVGNYIPTTYLKMAIMLRMRERFFSCIFRNESKANKELRSVIEAGLL